LDVGPSILLFVFPFFGCFDLFMFGKVSSFNFPNYFVLNISANMICVKHRCVMGSYNHTMIYQYDLSIPYTRE
jgi:hypothetical protein